MVIKDQNELRQVQIIDELMEIRKKLNEMHDLYVALVDEMKHLEDLQERERQKRLDKQ